MAEPDAEGAPPTNLVLPVLEELSFRACEPEDEDFLYSVYASTREADLEAVEWDDHQRDAFLRMQFDAQTWGWAQEVPDCERLIVLVDGQPAGRMFIDSSDERITIVELDLLPPHRGRGIGKRLVRLVLEQAAAEGMPVSSQVERTNEPSIKLQRGLGFVVADEDDDVFLTMRWTSLDLASVTADSFEAHVGDRFGCTASNGGVVDLVLAEVRRSGRHGEVREAFSLLFEGDDDPNVPQATRLLTHPELGGLFVFLVPLGRRRDRSEFEAVFT